MNEIANAGRTVHPFRRNRAILFSLLALVLVILSFHGVLDNLASNKLDELIKGTSGLLLASVAINAAVSVLQTVELDILFFSGGIGQVLDPVNDAAERLSLVLVWATGSLLLQDLLLKIASGSIFKLAFLAIAVMTATSLLLAQSDRARIALVTSLGISHLVLEQLHGLLIKTFVVATVARFIVPTFMIACLFVSQAFLAPEIELNSRELERYQKELSEVGAQISEARVEVIEEQTTLDETLTHVEAEDVVPDEQVNQPPSLSEQPVLSPEEELRTLRDKKTQLEERLARLESERKRLNNEIKEKRSGWFPGNTEEALAEANVQAEEIQSEIEHKESKLACLDRPTAGDNCESYLVELRKEALEEFKTDLESVQNNLQERLRSLWEDVTDVLWNMFGEGGAKVEDIKKEIAETEALATCVDLRISGEHCDSPDVDERVQSALDRFIREQTESDLGRLRAKLISLQAKQKRLTELTELETERRQTESQIKKVKELIDRNESEMECAKRRVAGKDCDTILDVGRQLMSGTWTEMSDVMLGGMEAAGRFVSSAVEMSRYVRDRLKTMADDTKDAVKRLTKLLVLTVIENIVLPIIFLAIALKASVPIARGLMRISTTMNEDARATLSAMDKALPSPKG